MIKLNKTNDNFHAINPLKSTIKNDSIMQVNYNLQDSNHEFY